MFHYFAKGQFKQIKIIIPRVITKRGNYCHTLLRQKRKKTTSSHDTCKSFIELTASLKSRHPSDIKYDYYMFSSLFREVGQDVGNAVF